MKSVKYLGAVVLIVVVATLGACGGAADGATMVGELPDGTVPTQDDSPQALTSTTPSISTTPLPSISLPAEGQSGGTWSGTASINVTSYGPCGANGELTQTATEAVSLPITAVISDPLPDETNAFQLSIATEPQAANGGVSVVSSGRYDTSTGPLTITYWQVTRSGDAIEGSLVDDATDEAASQNLLFANMWLDPCSDRLGSVLQAFAMKEGTTISGTLGPSTGSLQLSGSTVDDGRAFGAAITVTRNP
jgi:hypothetical protein